MLPNQEEMPSEQYNLYLIRQFIRKPSDKGIEPIEGTELFSFFSKQEKNEKITFYQADKGNTSIRKKVRYFPFLEIKGKKQDDSYLIEYLIIKSGDYFLLYLPDKKTRENSHLSFEGRYFTNKAGEPEKVSEIKKNQEELYHPFSYFDVKGLMVGEGNLFSRSRKMIGAENPDQFLKNYGSYIS